MAERSLPTGGRQDIQNLLLAVLAFVLSVGLGIGANWFFYNDYTQKRALREATQLRLQVMCAELREKRRKEPGNIYVIRDLQRCGLGRTRTEK
jgi:hypothetical protein